MIDYYLDHLQHHSNFEWMDGWMHSFVQSTGSHVFQLTFRPLNHSFSHKNLCLKAIKKCQYCSARNAKQSNHGTQVPFLIAAVIECNRFTAATVRKDTFSWYPFEWNDLTKWNLSPWPLSRWQGKSDAHHIKRKSRKFSIIFNDMPTFVSQRLKWTNRFLFKLNIYSDSSFWRICGFANARLHDEQHQRQMLHCSFTLCKFLICHVFSNGCHATIRNIYICMHSGMKKA